jgi:hypothetical protein
MPGPQPYRSRGWSIGTKTLLFGYHQLLLHPLFVAIAWWKLYGFPWDLRLWAAFFLHDIGYFGKPNMDGVEGSAHPFIGAEIMYILFDQPWYDFCLYHSRTIAKEYSSPVSKLCYADKLAFMLYPQWLLKFLYRLSGEYEQYLADKGCTTWEEWYEKAATANEITLKAVAMTKP